MNALYSRVGKDKYLNSVNPHTLFISELGKVAMMNKIEGGNDDNDDNEELVGGGGFEESRYKIIFISFFFFF
jgi:hypothetical protein